MLDTESFLLGIAAGGGGDGGNPNYIETIKGTLANPWGQSEELKPSFVTTLAEKIKSRDITALLQVKGEIDRTFPIVPDSWSSSVELESIISSAVFVLPDGTAGIGGCVVYTVDGVLTSAFLLNSDTEYAWADVSSLASQIPTILTIIHHPMP